ncbi:hypothetical protein ncot_08575 [Nocardioides sp. JQ2195]|uniref:hypothetical protein n=1 Tax=Nocardioides sp. JQ2195 TaxID=2592334 RepID=UPI00143E0F11|nr:hypothetical protein [Nocardioides sp. JQ2195]QIX26652.1 hypothetical protein ncot_08575 [Nocardioides sp. JQ2195]
MNKHSVVVTLLAVAGLLVGACAGGRTDVEERVGPVTLEVVSQDWSGWSKEQPDPENTRVSVSQGDTFSVPVIGDDVVVRVSEVHDEGMWIETDQDLMRKDDGFDDADDEFELENGVPLELTTTTMDAGTTITLTIA